MREAQRCLARLKHERNSSAASVIQTYLRNFVHRKLAKAELDRRRLLRQKELEELERQISEGRRRAAVRIQSRARMNFAQRRVTKVRKDRRRSDARRARELAVRQAINRRQSIL